MKLVLATKNKGKRDEIAALLNNNSFNVELLSLSDFPDMLDITEDGATFLDNALKKAREVCAFTNLPALADDSGLVVDALDGKPGVLSARFAPTTEERNEKLLRLMLDVDDAKRTARFVCSIALARPDGFEWSANGVCEGMISREVAGQEGFGYDPVFYYEPLGKTFAEIPRDEKNKISHRGIALGSFQSAVIRDGILGKDDE